MRVFFVRNKKKTKQIRSDFMIEETLDSSGVNVTSIEPLEDLSTYVNVIDISTSSLLSSHFCVLVFFPLC